MASEVRKLYFDRLGFGFGVKVQRNFGPDRKIIEAAAESVHGMSHWMAPEERKLYFDRLGFGFGVKLWVKSVT